MKKISRKSFITYILIGGGVSLLYLLFSHSASPLNRLINSLFIGSMIPLIHGVFRLVKALGLFNLFIYSHRKLWKFGKQYEKMEEENEAAAPGTTEKLGSYYDYLASKEPSPSCVEPLLAGGIYLLLSLIILFAVM